MLRLYVKYTQLKFDVRKMLGDEKGATAIEYGLIAAGIAVAIIAVVFSIGTEVKNQFTTVQTQLQAGG
jgi:pilus assembly protein Flp/PilA